VALVLGDGERRQWVTPLLALEIDQEALAARRRVPAISAEGEGEAIDRYRERWGVFAIPVEDLDPALVETAFAAAGA
jgi:hypothetical protein